MNNRQKKKESAGIFNRTRETMDKILQIGSCTCGGTLFMYLASEPENYFKVYCTDCDSIDDVRSPKEGNVIWNGPSKLLDYLAVNVYGEDEIEKHIADHSCANNKERVKNEETELFEMSRYDNE